MTTNPIPLSPEVECIVPLPDPPQPVHCYTVDDAASAPHNGTALNLGQGSDVQDAQDTLRDLANHPADPDAAARLHDLIYPPGLDAGQIAGIVAAVIIALLILGAVVVARRRRSAS